ncbi:hypothetical protein V6C42_01365 [Pseudoclostridium thermosuccinogenes]|uniref:hypothetical protein n=1 Tax=Clostridium thermosuccinogenes TaxID=84032 RepID=UPI002FD954F5
MNKKFQRVVALSAAMLLTVGVLASCGNKGENKNAPSTTQETNGEVPELASQWPEFAKHHSIEVTFFEQGWTGPEEDKDFVTPEIEKRTNFGIKYIPMTVPTSDDYTQKLNLMVASDEVPEIFFGANDSYTRTIYEKLGQSGKIWDVADIIKDYENIYNLVYPELNLFKTKDGKNYFIPTQTGRGNDVLHDIPNGLFVRKDFLDQLGMDYPDTPEEFKEYLKRSINEIKVNGQPVTGLVLGENLDGIQKLYEPFFPLVGQHESYKLPFDPKDGYKIKNYLYNDSPELIEAAKYIYSLAKEGLLDKETLTLKQAMIQEKASSGLAAAISVAYWDMNTYGDNAKQTVPNIMYVAPPTMYASEKVKESRLADWTNWVGSWSTVIINKKVDEEALRHFLAVMDYMATEEGQLLVQYGIEGESYVLNAEGKVEMTSEFLEKTNNMDWNKAAAYGVGYYAQLVYNLPVILDKQGTPASLLREDNKLSWENQKEYRDHYVANMEPTLDYYFLPGEIETQKFTAIKDGEVELWVRVLTANSEDEVEKIVHEWGETCRKLGINEIIAEREQYIKNFKVSK